MTLNVSRFKPWIVLMFCCSTFAASSVWAQTEEETEQFAAIMAAAVSGDAEAQYALGRVFGEGGGIFGQPENAASALMWYTRSAEQGNDRAQFMLGRAYDRGLYGQPKSNNTALLWYTKSAEQGNVDAQTFLGIRYFETGKDVPEDAVKAVSWLTKASLKADTNAQFLLGMSYQDGHGIQEDDATAASWYAKAAEQGHALAQANLGLMYATGEGVPQDTPAALSWFVKAAEQGHAGAQTALQAYYESGGRVFDKDGISAVSGGETVPPYTGIHDLIVLVIAVIFYKWISYISKNVFLEVMDYWGQLPLMWIEKKSLPYFAVGFILFLAILVVGLMGGHGPWWLYLAMAVSIYYMAARSGRYSGYKVVKGIAIETLNEVEIDSEMEEYLKVVANQSYSEMLEQARLNQRLRASQ